MGRGNAAEVEAVRRRIVGEATRLFAEQGFAGTSIAAIAKASGVSKALVLYHFEHKEALRNEVFRGLVEHWGQLLPKVLTSLQEGGDPLDGVLASAVQLLRDDRYLARFLMRELLRPDGEVARLLADRTSPATGMAAAALTQLRGGAALPEGLDPEAALVLMGLVLATIFAVFPTQPDGSLGRDGLGDRVLEQAVRALRAALD